MGARILIVEDNPQNRLLVKDILEIHGYEILEVENGQAGIESAKTQRPDLVLMDIQMPVMDGFEACRRLREEPELRGLKIVAVTSFAMKGEKEKVLSSGFDGYVAKPINTRELPALVKGFLEERESGKE